MDSSTQNDCVYTVKRECIILDIHMLTSSCLKGSQGDPGVAGLIGNNGKTVSQK